VRKSLDARTQGKLRRMGSEGASRCPYTGRAEENGKWDNALLLDHLERRINI